MPLDCSFTSFIGDKKWLMRSNCFVTGTSRPTPPPPSNLRPLRKMTSRPSPFLSSVSSWPFCAPTADMCSVQLYDSPTKTLNFWWYLAMTRIIYELQRLWNSQLLWCFLASQVWLWLSFCCLFPFTLTVTVNHDDILTVGEQSHSPSAPLGTIVALRGSWYFYLLDRSEIDIYYDRISRNIC